MSATCLPRATAVLLALVARPARLPARGGPAARPRRAALRARGRRDAPGRRVGDARRCAASPGSRSRRSTTGWPGGAFRVLGETEAAARVPSVLAALLLVGATALFGARLYGSAAGLHAGFVAGLSLLPFAYGRAASMDMLLAATVTVAIGLVGAAAPRHRRAARDRGRRRVRRPRDARQGARSACCCRCLVVGGYVLATREWRSLRELLSPPAHRRVPRRRRALVRRRSSSTRAAHFLDVFILNHNVQRFTSTVHNHPGAVLVLPARAARRALPLVGARDPGALPPSPARVAHRPLPAAVARSARSSSSRSPAPSCPATSCRACPRSPS